MQRNVAADHGPHEEIEKTCQIPKKRSQGGARVQVPGQMQRADGILRLRLGWMQKISKINQRGSDSEGFTLLENMEQHTEEYYTELRRG